MQKEKKTNNSVLENEPNEHELLNRKILSIEAALAVVTFLMFLVFVSIACFTDMSDSARLWVIIAATTMVLLIIPILMKIEQIVGSYKCGKCGYEYMPTYKAINLAPHAGRRRFIRCPNCNKTSWHKKVTTKPPVE